MIDGKPWFVAKDVCDVLGIRVNSIRSILEEYEILELKDNSIVVNEKGRKPLIVSEPGFYSLVAKSRKPQAKVFKRWVNHDVLPFFTVSMRNCSRVAIHDS